VAVGAWFPAGKRLAANMFGLNLAIAIPRKKTGVTSDDQEVMW